MNLITLQMKWSLSPSAVWTFKLPSHSYSSFSLALLEGKQKDTIVFMNMGKLEYQFVTSQVNGALLLILVVRDFGFSLICVNL